MRKAVPLALLAVSFFGFNRIDAGREQNIEEAIAGPFATFTVTNTNDSGPGSLRQAILDANGAAGLDTF